MSARELDRVEEQAVGNKKAPELSGALPFVKNGRRAEDSNPRPLVLETSALTRLSYAPAYLIL